MPRGIWWASNPFSHGWPVSDTINSFLTTSRSTSICFLSLVLSSSSAVTLRFKASSSRLRSSRISAGKAEEANRRRKENRRMSVFIRFSGLPRRCCVWRAGWNLTQERKDRKGSESWNQHGAVEAKKEGARGRIVKFGRASNGLKGAD